MLPRWPTHGFAPCAQRRSILEQLGFERQLQLCSISEPCEHFAPTYQRWLHSGVSAYGSQIGAHMCGERPAAIPTPLATTSGPCVQHCNQLPGKGSYASTKFFRGELDKCRDDANNSYELMVWLGARLTQALLPGQFFLGTAQKKTLGLGPPP